MNRDEELASAIAASLGMRPDGRPGVARLAQELLAHVAGLPLNHPPAPTVEHRRHQRGGPGNRVGPWNGSYKRKAK